MGQLIGPPNQIQTVRFNCELEVVGELPEVFWRPVSYNQIARLSSCYIGKLSSSLRDIVCSSAQLTALSQYLLLTIK